MRKLQILLPMMLVAILSFAQQKTVTGTVVNQTTKEPLLGVTVQAKNKAVTTDATGKFSIEATPGEVLIISFVGMNTQKIKVPAGIQNLIISMEEGTNDLNEVVVT